MGEMRLEIAIYCEINDVYLTDVFRSVQKQKTNMNRFQTTKSFQIDFFQRKYHIVIISIKAA